MVTHLELWQRIDDFAIDDETSDFPFSARLARDNGWSDEFTARAIEEYKRFAYLAVASGHSVTPSDEVDQVWHLHLTYTRNYWDEFCAKILQTPLHHGPTTGSQSDASKFRDWYDKTKASYAKEFDASPPLDLWPETDDRFADVSKWRRVNTDANFVLSKPNLGVLPVPLLFGALLMGLSSCSANTPFGPVVELSFGTLFALIVTGAVINTLWRILFRGYPGLRRSVFILALGAAVAYIAIGVEQNRWDESAGLTAPFFDYLVAGFLFLTALSAASIVLFGTLIWVFKFAAYLAVKPLSLLTGKTFAVVRSFEDDFGLSAYDLNEPTGRGARSGRRSGSGGGCGASGCGGGCGGCG